MEREEIKVWFDRLQKAEDRRDESAKKGKWKDILKAAKGDWSPWSSLIDIVLIPINLVFAYLKVEVPALYLRDPRVKINPRNRTSIFSAKILQAAIRYIWYCKKIKREIKKCIQDGKLIGHSWFKSGYTGEFGTIEDGNGNLIETVESEDFFGYRVPWDCMVFDTDATDPPYDCRWIAHYVWASIEDVKNNEKYSKSAVAKLKPTAKKDDLTKNGELMDKKQAKACLIEVWDLDTKTVFTLAKGVDEALEEPKEWPYEMRGYPFSFLQFNPVNDEPYGVSDVSMWIYQVLELIKVRSATLDHLKRFNRQVFMQEGNISDDEEEKYKQGITGSIIKVKDIGQIKESPFGALNPDIYNIENKIKDDLVNVSGQTPGERGGSQQTGTRTVKELMVIDDGVKNRRSEQQDVVEDFVEDIVQNQTALLKQYASEPYYVRILGNEDPNLAAAVKERASAANPEAVTNQQGFTFTSEDIKGEYDIEIVSGSMAPLDSQQRLKYATQLLELAPKAGAMPGGPVIGALGKILSEEIDMPEIIVAMEQEQQMAAQMKEQQAAQAQQMQDMEIAKETAKTSIGAENMATKQTKVQYDFMTDMLKLASEEKKAQKDEM